MTTTASVTAPPLEAILEGLPHGNFVAGAWRDSDDRIAVRNPSTGAGLIDVADGPESHFADALEAAVGAQQSWANASARRRADILLSAYTMLLEQQDIFAHLIAAEMGKTLREAYAEVDYSAEFLRWFGEQAPRSGGEYRTAPDGKTRILTSTAPVGPCLLVTPWNFPLAMAARKVAPAIAAGCTMILKPASQTPLTALKFAQLLDECGVPAGVFNVVVTSRASALSKHLIADRRLRKVSFTGSTEVGRGLLRLCAQNVTRASMELGGNAPLLVFDDADLEKAVDGAVTAKMRNNGESCVGANRILVHRDIASEFTDRFVQRMAAQTMGDAMTDVDFGPLIDDRQRASVHAFVESALRGGADARTGGEIPVGEGFYYPATVLTGLDGRSDLLEHEIFGPVAPIVTFNTEEEALELANNTEFGLAAYVFTENLARALRVVDGLEVGMTGVNRGLVSNAAAPFGGVKASGLGREGGCEGIQEYLDVRYASLAM